MAFTRPRAAQIDFDVTNISDPLIRLNSAETGSADKDVGIVIERGNDTNTAIIYDESANEFAVINTTETGTTSGNVTIASYADIRAGTFYGDGSGLTGVTSYTDSDVASYLSANGYDTSTNIISSITDSAPATLDTLNELAAALGDDANFSTTVTNSIATKLPLAGGTMSGAIAMGVNAITTSGTITYGTLNDGTTALTSTVEELNYLDGVTGITLGSANELLVVGGDGSSIVSDSTLAVDTSNNRLGINQSSPEVTLHMTGEGAQTAQIRMEQYNDSADAPDLRTRRYRGTIASPSAIQSGDYLYRSNHEYWNGSALIVGGQFAFDNTNNANRTQFTVAVTTDGTSVEASTNDDVQFKIDGNDGGAITFNDAYKFPTSDGSANQFLQTDGSGAVTFASATVSDISDLTATAAELNYTDGVTSNIQTQLDGKLTGNQTITLSGDASGSGTTAITVTVADDSHNHIISNIDGLQTALDAKLASSSYTAADVLTKIKTVDGSGSGLDADLLDGQQGSYYLNTSTSFGGDVSGTYNAIVIANDSHTHAFDNLTGKTSGTGEYSTNHFITAGRGSGGVSLTHNDGYGNANITWNHKSGVPEQNGNAARIHVNTDASTNAAMVFQVKSGVSSGAAITLTQALSLSETTSTFSGDVNVSTGKLQEGGNALIPAGSIIMYGAASAPGGWYLCEGGAISRSTYAALFSAIGTTYGVGDGSTTFNVPDFRDRAPYGASTFTLGTKTAGEVNASGQNSTGTGTSGSTGGSTVASTTGSDGPTTHSVTTSTTNSTTDKDVTNSITVVTGVSAHATHTHTIPSLTVNGHTHSVPALTVTHPGVAVKFIIKT